MCAVHALAANGMLRNGTCVHLAGTFGGRRPGLERVPFETAASAATCAFLPRLAHFPGCRAAASPAPAATWLAPVALVAAAGEPGRGCGVTNPLQLSASAANVLWLQRSRLCARFASAGFLCQPIKQALLCRCRHANFGLIFPTACLGSHALGLAASTPRSRRQVRHGVAVRCVCGVRFLCGRIAPTARGLWVDHAKTESQNEKCDDTCRDVKARCQLAWACKVVQKTRGMALYKNDIALKAPSRLHSHAFSRFAGLQAFFGSINFCIASFCPRLAVQGDGGHP